MRRFRVDLHAHHIPPVYREALRRVGATRIAGAPLPSWTPPAAMRFMDRYGIQAQVVSISEPGVERFAPDDAIAVARQVNASSRDLVEAYPTRFGALALLPLADIDAAVAEIAHALDELGLDGVGLPASFQGRSLGDPAFAPILAELDQRGAYVFVHPASPGPDDRPGLALPVFLYEFMFDTTRAVSALLLSGAFARHPDIRWQFAHAGAAAPALSERLAAHAERSDGPGARAEVARALAGLHYDTAGAPAPPTIAALREVAPLEHIVFGSDWPFGQALLLTGGDPQPELSQSFTATERRAIERDHAFRLVPRLARALGAT